MTEIDTTGLPQELIQQLAIKRDNYDVKHKILNVMGDLPMNMNEILIAIYRQYDCVLKRTTVVATLQKLKSTGEIKTTGVGRYKKRRTSSAEAA